jgi:hypothetical protein
VGGVLTVCLALENSWLAEAQNPGLLESSSANTWEEYRGIVQVVSGVTGALEFGGAPAVALAAMLQIGKTLDADEFANRVVPALSKLFTSTDRSIRRSLLENIDTYGPHLDQVCGRLMRPFPSAILAQFLYVPI